MTLVCFGSAKGAPGVTLTSLLVAAAWPTEDGRSKALVEADPAGGSLALRYRLASRPGLLSLAAAGASLSDNAVADHTLADHTLDEHTLAEHTQKLPGGLAVVVAPPSPEQVGAAIGSIGGQLGRWLAAGPGDYLADVGRLSVASEAAAFTASADAVLVVARPVPEQLQPAARRMKALSATCHVGWVLIGRKPYSPSDVSDAFGFPVVAALADDPRTADAITAGADPHKLKRSSLTGDIAGFASSLSGWLNQRRRTVAGFRAGEESRAVDRAFAAEDVADASPVVGMTAGEMAVNEADAFMVRRAGRQ